ncbi:MAG: hypothetical protein L6R48_19365, partial [Planctomycetes bacterium]|nr:hypothetical protein [Planctomycetota bacterium]
MIPLRRLLSLLPLLLAGVALASEIDARSRLVWAHYTPWFQPVDTVELAVRQDNACDLPLAGDLDRRLAAEIAGARAMGADGFLVDVVMHARQRPDTAYLRRMLAVAAREGFLVGLCLDPVHADAQAIAAGAAALLDDCAGLPAYPLVGGRPLLSTYRVREDGPAVWRQVRAELRRGGRDPFLLGDLMSPNLVLDAEAVDAYAGCFDGLYQFCEYGGSRSAAGRPQPPAAAEAVLAAAAARQGLVHAGLVMPGYLGRWHQGRNPYHLPFHGFQVLLGWGRLAGAGRPGWLHLTTWNDHDETALMPTVFTGAVNTELVAALVADWRGGARAAARPRCHLAYPREVLVGTPLHIDCLVQMGQ